MQASSASDLPPWGFDGIQDNHEKTSTSNQDYQEYNDEEEALQSSNRSSKSSAVRAQASQAILSELTPMQRMATTLSHILALVAVALVSTWINLLGGLSWAEGEAKEVFNWHPLMMVLAFTFMTVASLSFRCSCRSGNRYWNKVTHVLSWFVAASCATVGIIAVVKSHNDGASGYIANLYSLHSWIGIGVILFYTLQLVAGTTFFVFQVGTSSVKSSMLQLHVFFGPYIYNLTVMTIVLGILEKETFFNCSYEVQEADLFPIQHFFEIPTECRVSHFLGVIVVLMGLLTSYALFDFKKLRARSSHVD